jgi:hypothetical protein
MKRTVILACVLVPLVTAPSTPGPARAQSSANFRLVPGTAASGGSATSASRRLVGAVATPNWRASSASRDVAVGFPSVAFNLQQATVTIPLTGGQYSSVALPVEMADASPAGAFSELGPLSAPSWRMSHWSPTDSAYVEAGGALTSLSDNQGYWLITAGNSNPTVTGRVANPLNIETVALIDGPGGRAAYNQLGNPFLFPIPIAAVFANQGATSFQLTNAGNTFTEQVVKVWNGTGYTNVGAGGVINGRTAFWVKKVASGAVNILLLPVASPTGTPRSPLEKPEGADWVVAVTARQGERIAEPLMVGAAPVMAGEWNPLCISKAPDPPGGMLSAHLAKSDWGRLNGDYVREFRPAQETMSWDFVVRSSESPGETELKISTLDLPVGSRVVLSDPAAGWSREVANDQVVRIATTSSGRNLRLTASTSGGGPAIAIPADGFRGAIPNPFTGRAALTFQLARGGDVELGIYDVLGRRLRSLSRTGLGPGEHVLTWDGRDEQGHAAPAGVYLARYRVGEVAGSTRLVRVE